MFDKDIITPLPDKNEQRLYIFVYTKRIFYEDINDKVTWILRELLLILFWYSVFWESEESYCTLFLWNYGISQRHFAN